MSISANLRHAALAAGLLLAPHAALADSITLGTNYSGTFDMLINASAGSTSYTATQEGGGNVSGSYGIIGGTQVNLGFVFCADIFTDATLGATYTASFNTSATINTGTLADAGQIAWLMLNIAPTATTQAQMQGLQGLMWTLEYSSRVKWDTADNSASATSWYNTYLSELGSNTANVSRIYWVDPLNSNGTYGYQGFAVATWSQIPEAPSAALLATSAALLLASRRRRA